MTTIPKGYGWAGNIARQYGAWLCYWTDGEEEGHTAHSSLASAKRYLRTQVFTDTPLRYEPNSEVQVNIYAKGLSE